MHLEGATFPPSPSTTPSTVVVSYIPPARDVTQDRGVFSGSWGGFITRLFSTEKSRTVKTVSVIIPNYNGRRFLKTCLTALEAQTYPREYLEVILVDDASQDDSVSYVQRMFPHVRVLPLQKNSGLAVACNRGAAVARGEIIALLNNDTEVEPGWVGALVRALEEHPWAGAAASKILLFDRRHILHSAGDMVGLDGIPRNRGVWEEDRGQYDEDRVVFGGCGGAVAYRRVVWDALGGFDEDLFMYLEDVDLAWRMQLRGWGTVFAPEARVYHHLSATGGGPLASFYTGRNTIWVIAKNMPSRLLQAHWPKILAAQWRITRQALAAWRGKAARARLRGQWAGITGLPRIWPKRRSVQADIRVDLDALEALLRRAHE